jgi:hypothetical protein
MGNIDSVQLDMPDREDDEPDITENQRDNICGILEELWCPVPRGAFSKIGIEQASVLLDQLIEVREDLRGAKEMGLDKPAPSGGSDKAAYLAVTLLVALLVLAVIVTWPN